MKALTVNIILVCSLIYSEKIIAQFKAVNIAEYQLGNIPEVEPDDLHSFYNQLNLSYRYNKFSASTRLEMFTVSHGEDRDYIKPTQYKLSFNSKYVSLDAGTMYSTLGRGLLLRSYEIPASVFESRGYRVRHGFYKDLEGFSGRFKSKYFDVKLLRGHTLTVDLPPVLKNDERRTDLIEGGELSGKLKGQAFGLIYMRHENNGNENNYVSAYYNGTIDNLTFYGELAQRANDFSDISKISDEETWGIYVGLNYTWDNIGISLEYKDYNQFAIGNGVNEPPTLIKEHQWIVLNRSTHVPLIDNENGFQAEIYYNFDNGNRVLLNHAQAKNEIGSNILTYKEYHIDYSANLSEKILIRTFINYSEAPLLSETHRYAFGSLTDFEHKNRFSSSFNIEYQNIERNSGLGAKRVNNGVVSYTFSKSNKYSLSALLEITDDPFLIKEGESQELYPSITINYQFNRKYKLSAFIGKRRGGPACTSGVCYEVLDFKGAELRFTSRFL